MSKFQLQHALGIVPVREQLPLADYDERLGDDYLTVWLNLDDEMVQRWNAYKDEETKLKALIQGEEHTPDELQQIRDQVRTMERLAVPFYADLWEMPHEDAYTLYRVNQPLFAWCSTQSWEMIHSYRQQRKKAPAG